MARSSAKGWPPRDQVIRTQFDAHGSWSRNRHACRPVGQIVADARAHALHAAAEAVRAAGDGSWARDLHSMGQMVLTYSVSDIDKILADLAGQIAAQGSIVDGGQSVH